MTRARDLAAFVSNADGDIKFDTDTLFIDSSANRVGIGTNTPSADLTVSSSNATIHFNDEDDSTYGEVRNNGGTFTIASDEGAAAANSSINFKVDGSEAMRIDSDGNVGIGTSSPSDELHINSSSANVNLRLTRDTDTGARISGSDGGSTPAVIFETISGGTITERMRIDSSGNLLVGTTDFAPAGNGETGFSARSSGYVIAGVSNQQVMLLNRSGTDGDILQFRKNGSQVGSIGYGSRFYIADTSIGLGFDAAGTDNILPCDDDGGLIDNAIDLGVASARFDDIFATNTSIQTSDEREKQQIASLTNAEITAATAISKLFKTYKWNDSVADNGDNARTHTGVVAQQVETAMSNAGLDASKYAFWCSDTWWETETEVAAVEADEENGIEAKDAYTRTDHYFVAEEAPEGATERNRKGIRYPELLSFIGAATEQRLTSIESRLDALEAE